MRKFWHLLIMFGCLLSFASVQGQAASSLTFPPRPVWSPDGQHIVYTGRDGTYVMDRDGKNSRQITPHDVFFEHWTPDSKTLIFNGGYAEDQNQLWFYPLDGSEPQPAFQDFFTIWRYTYSHDGRHLALLGRKNQNDLFGMWLIDVVNGFPAADPVLLADSALSDYFIFDIQWAKSGDELILRANPQESPDQLVHIYLPLHQSDAALEIEPLNPETTFYLSGGWELNFDPERSSRPLIYTITSVNHPADEISIPLERVMSGFGITQSLDEQTLAYAHACDPEGISNAIADESASQAVSTYTALSTFDLTTGVETLIFSCDQTGMVVTASFSPDGSSILFDVTDEETGWHIYRADQSAGAVIDLVDITPAG